MSITKKVSYVLNMQMSTIANSYGFVTSIIRSNGEIGQVWVTWFVAPLSTYQAGSCTTSGVAMWADVAWPIKWVLKEVSLKPLKVHVRSCLIQMLFLGVEERTTSGLIELVTKMALSLTCIVIWYIVIPSCSCVSLIKTIPTLVNSVCVTGHNDLVFQLWLLPLPFSMRIDSSEVLVIISTVVFVKQIVPMEH